MHDTEGQDSELQKLLADAIAGDAAAMDALLNRSCDRLTTLTRRMMGQYPGVKRWAETDDILQNALLRLLKALRDVRPQSPRDFLALATLQIRRELIDMARRFYGPEGIGANHDSQGREMETVIEPRHSPEGSEPFSLMQWSELHEQIDGLPEQEREVVGLLFYQGLDQATAASILSISVRTLQRRWHAALCQLHRIWNESLQ